MNMQKPSPDRWKDWMTWYGIWGNLMMKPVQSWCMKWFRQQGQTSQPRNQRLQKKQPCSMLTVWLKRQKLPIRETSQIPREILLWILHIRWMTKTKYLDWWTVWWSQSADRKVNIRETLWMKHRHRLTISQMAWSVLRKCTRQESS